MYEKYWGLKEKPFKNTPDPRFLYYSGGYEDAFMKLLYTVEEQMGVAMLTGVFGCGKTVLARAFLKEIGINYKVVLIANPSLNSEELLMTIAQQLGAKDLPVKKTEVLTNLLLDDINEILLNNIKDGKGTVIIVDEAHTIEEDEVFEKIRLLLNFQLEDRFLLTLILLGQPELRRRVESIKSLEQRIAFKCSLSSLSLEDTQKYMVRRLSVAGRDKPIFDESAVNLIYKSSGGIPRRINHICDISLFIGFDKKVDIIGGEVVEEAVRELEGR